MRNRNRDLYITRVDKLLEKFNSDLSCHDFHACFFGALTIINSLYGENSSQLKSLIESKQTTQRIGSVGYNRELEQFQSTLFGILKNLKEELETGLLENIVNKVESEV